MRRLSGPLLTVLTLVALEALALTAFRIPTPLPILLTTVVYTALTGGVSLGLVSAVLTIAYGVYSFATPGRVFHYGADEITRLVVLGVTAPTIAVMIWVLRFRAERAQRETTARLHTLASGAPIGIFMTDVHGVPTYVNPRYETICGFSLEENRRRGWASFLHPDDREATLAEWARCMRERREYVHEHRFVGATGDVRWVRTRAAPMASIDGKLLGYVGTIEDITDEQTAAVLRAEAKARQHVAQALAELGHVVSRSANPQEVAERVVASARVLLRVESAVVNRLDPASGDLAPLAYVGRGAGMHIVLPRGAGASGLALKLKAPVATPNSFTDPRIHLPPDVRNRMTHTPYGAVLAVPLLVQDRVLGTFSVLGRIGRVFDEEEIRLASAFADFAAMALENARLYEEAERRRQVAEALAEVGRLVTLSLDPAEVSQRIAESARTLLHARAAATYLLDPDTGDLVQPAYSGDVASVFEPGTVFPKGTGVVGLAMREGRPVNVRNVLESPEVVLTPALRARVENSSLHSVVAAPLIVEGEVIGALAVADRAGRIFDEGEAELVQAFAHQAAIAVRNSQSFAREREARERAEASEGSLRLLFANGPLPMWVFDLETLRFLEVNEAAITHYGYARDEFLAMRITDIRPPEDIPRLFASLGDTILNRPGITSLGEWTHRCKDGRLIDVDSTSHELEFAGRPAALVVVQDITDRKRAAADAERRRQEAESLAELGRVISQSLDSEEVAERIVASVRSLIGAHAAAVCALAPGSRDLVVLGRSGDTRLNLTPNRVVAGGTTLSDLAVERRAPVATPDLLDDPVVVLPADMRARLGETTFRSALAVPLLLKDRVVGTLVLRDRQGRVFTPDEIRLVQAFADHAAIAIENAQLYAEAKAARRNTEVSESRYRALFDDVPVGLFRSTPAGEILAANRALVAILGYPDRATLLATNVRELHPNPEERQPHLERIEREGLVRWIDTQRKRHDGSIIWVRQTIHAVKDDGGRVIAYEGAVEDITERKRAEEALARTMERLTILHEIDQAIIAARSPEAIADVALRPLLQVVPCVRASVTMFDLEGHEAIVLATVGAEGGGQHRSSLRVFGNLDQLKHDLLTREGLRTLRSRPDGVARPCLSVPLIADGEPIGIVNLLGQPTGLFTAEHVDVVREVAGPLAIAIRQAHLNEDVGAARQRLEILSRRLVEVQEAQRRHLARELHDEVGQLLTGLKLSLGAAARSASPGLRARLAESRKLVGNLMARVRELSLDLRPAMLDDLGLVPAFLWQFERYAAQTKVRVSFKHAGVEGRRFPSEAETAAYRIVQEALTNVARHAGVAEVAVRLWADDRTLTAQVEDRGVGLGQRRQAAHRGYGLAGMIERAALLGGQVVLETPDEGGLRVTAELPIAEVPAPGAEK